MIITARKLNGLVARNGAQHYIYRGSVTDEGIRYAVIDDCLEQRTLHVKSESNPLKK